MADLNMQVIIVGTGKLATELMNHLGAAGESKVASWIQREQVPEGSIVVHAGSGKDLQEVIAYCERTCSPLIELSTGSCLEGKSFRFPVVLCPNTNLLMLKFMNMLEKHGHLFSGYKMKFIESHQAQKASVPGTALSMARALGLRAGDVLSIRDPGKQVSELRIPVESLDRHAYHQIVIEDAACRITMETRVEGASPYADGVAKIISAVRHNALERRIYEINEFINNEWI